MARGKEYPQHADGLTREHFVQAVQQIPALHPAIVRSMIDDGIISDQETDTVPRFREVERDLIDLPYSVEGWTIGIRYQEQNYLLYMRWGPSKDIPRPGIVSRQKTPALVTELFINHLSDNAYQERKLAARVSRAQRNTYIADEGIAIVDARPTEEGYQQTHVLHARKTTEGPSLSVSTVAEHATAFMRCFRELAMVEESLQ